MVRVETRSPEHVALGRAIRELRGRAGISQEDLGDRCDLHRTYIGGIERGERNPSFTNLLKIAQALGVSVVELFEHYETALAAGAERADAGRRRPTGHRAPGDRPAPDERAGR